MAKRPSSLISRAAGITFRIFRARASMSQEILALSADVGIKHMSSIEAGKHSMTLDTLYRLVQALGISFEQFGVELDRTLQTMTVRNPRKHDNSKPKRT